MGSAVNFPGSNRTLTAPGGHEGHVSDLHVFANEQVCVSCWQLSAEELSEVVRSGGKLWLSVFFGGGTQSPTYVGSERTTREVVADYGPVWRRQDHAGE